MPLLKIEDLSFTYALSSLPSLKSVTAELHEGEFVLLCGPSGCGKSTLLRQIKRELTPAGKKRGRILFDAKTLEELTSLQAACDIGLVMQSPDSQLVTGNVMSELSFGLENLGFEPEIIRRRVAEMASFFGIGSWFHRDTDTLSGGQKQIVNLASVLAMQPRLLLLDEPTAQLDPVTARELIEMVTRLNRELGITVLMTEHRLEEVLPLADRVMIMQEGSLRLSAPPRELSALLLREGLTDTFDYLPAAARIYHAVEGSAGQAPLTVSEGRAYVKKCCADFIFEPHKIESKKETRQPLIDCDGVYFGYTREADILRDLSINAYEGELLCIFGENGSGKSTLLNLLAGLSSPRRGSMKLMGRDIRRLSSRELYQNGIALLPQNPKALFVTDSLSADLKQTAEGNGSKDEIGPLADKFGLAALLNRHPYDLSGGELQKAALLKILLTHPRLLLLDEPTKGLDITSKKELTLILKGLCAEGESIILITHDVEFAAEAADRCMLLSDGRAACIETPARFFGGNYFYTTAANRIARDIDWSAITCEEVVALCRKTSEGS